MVCWLTYQITTAGRRDPQLDPARAVVERVRCDRMPIPRPKVPPPPLAELRGRLSALGLPPLIACTPLAPPWVHANYRLRFDERSRLPDLLLRRRVADPGHDTFAHELAALTALRGADVPVVASYRVLPDDALPWPAVISDLIPGTQGFALIREQPQHASQICRATGELVARLEGLSRPGFATGVDGGRFVTRRATWRDAWTDLVWSWWTAARLAGTDLGPLGARVWDRLQQLLPSLDTADRWALIHADLHPSNLLFVPDGDGVPQLSGVVDWEGALVGDPLVEWALLVELPDPTLGHVLTGIGVDRVQALLDDPDALRRLEAYRLSRTIRRLGFGALNLFRGDGGVRRSYSLEYGRVVAIEALDRPVADKLRASLALGTSGEVLQRFPAPPTSRVVWQGLDALRFRSNVPSIQRATVIGAALAVALRDRRHHDLGVELARRAGPQSLPQRGAPLVDRSAWEQALVRAVADRPDRPLAAALAALCFTALDTLAHEGVWPVPDDALLGLEGLVRALLAAEPPEEDPVRRVASTLIGAAGYAVLAARGADVADATDHAADAVRHAWEDHTLFGEAAEGSVAGDAVWERLATRPDPDRPRIPLLLWALAALDPDLPAPADRVLAALGLEA